MHALAMHVDCCCPCHHGLLTLHHLTNGQGYKELYKRKWAYTQELAVSIQAGLQKMVEAKEDVNKMKVS